jgi:hypothetical protein
MNRALKPGGPVGILVDAFCAVAALAEPSPEVARLVATIGQIADEPTLKLCESFQLRKQINAVRNLSARR